MKSIVLHVYGNVQQLVVDAKLYIIIPVRNTQVLNVSSFMDKEERNYLQTGYVISMAHTIVVHVHVLHVVLIIVHVYCITGM